MSFSPRPICQCDSAGTMVALTSFACKNWLNSSLQKFSGRIGEKHLWWSCPLKPMSTKLFNHLRRRSIIGDKGNMEIGTCVYDMIEVVFVTFLGGPVHTVHNDQFVEFSRLRQMGRSCQLGTLSFKAHWTLHIGDAINNFFTTVVRKNFGKQTIVRMA